MCDRCTMPRDFQRATAYRLNPLHPDPGQDPKSRTPPILASDTPIAQIVEPSGGSTFWIRPGVEASGSAGL